MTTLKDELVKVIRQHLKDNIHDCIPDVLAQAISDYLSKEGWVRKGEIELDEEKILGFLFSR